MYPIKSEMCYDRAVLLYLLNTIKVNAVQLKVSMLFQCHKMIK